MFEPFLVSVLVAVFAVIQPTTGQNPPTWNTGTSFTKTSSDCTEITDLSATSQSGDTVLYSVESQTPNDAGFTTDVNFASDPILTCVAGSVSQSSYVVVVRAKYQSDAGQADLTITITFTDQSPATGPTWNTGTSHTLDKTDANACNSVTTLSATSTDSSTVTYSIQGSSVFTITGSNILSCTLGDITLSSYTVVVRANQDNNVPTDITLNITVTGLSSGSGGGSSEGESTTEESDDGWKYGVAFGTVGAVGVTVGGLIFAMKAAKRRDKRRDDKNKKDPALGKSSGSMVTDTNIVKPKEDVKSPLPSTAEKADNALPNGDVAV